MESPGSLSLYGDASSAVDEVIPVPDVQATIGSEGDDPAQQAEAAPTGGDGEQGAVEDHQGDAKKDEGEAPYEYPTGVVGIEELSMLPSMNAYEQWAATPGIPGEPLENVALTLKFEAMGAQDLTVGLAHKRGGKGGMYQLIIGNKGNLQVDLEKIQGRHIETVASRAGLLCSSSKAHKYWVSVKNGRLDFGVGGECGQHTVLSYQDAESPPIEVRYVGFTCLRHRATFRDVKMEAEIGGPLRSEVETDLEFVRAEGCDEGFSGEDKASLDAALEQYKKECDSMKRRARKFGTAYSPPFLQDWVPWTLVKRLSWNRDLEGGIDRESKEEREKRKLRAERFGGSEASTDAALEALKTPLGASVDPKVAEMMTEEKRYARSQKFSIPDQMWSIQAEEQGMRPADIFCQDPDRADPEPMATTFPHKIHIFSLDKMVCKQIRDNDVKAYFHGFGPKYVEWLSDWSFNVVFQDPEEAKNAAAAKSFGLPEVLPREIADTLEEGAAEAAEMGAMGWRLGLPMCKVHRDRWGPEGQWVRLLLRCSEAQDILLARPDTPAKPEGPVLRRGMVPPAVRTAQRLAGGDGGEGRRGGGGGGKRRRRDGGESGAEVMGQALKSQRTSKKRREPPKEEKKEWEGKGNSLAVAAAACAAANAAANAAAVGTAAAAVAAAAADTAGSSNAAGAAGAAGTAQHEDNPTAESSTPLPPADS